MKTIAIDGDGVLLDYNAAYAKAWHKAFGELPELKNPNAYWALDRWTVKQVDGSELDRLRAAFDDEFWSTIPPIPGALEACELLVGLGYELVCVTALTERHLEARSRNLSSLGFPVSKVICTSNVATSQSPKANVLQALKPVAFIDDYAPYLVGVDPSIHLALIMRDPEGSPNHGELLRLSHSQHPSLMDFASWWANSEVTRDTGG